MHLLLCSYVLFAPLALLSSTRTVLAPALTRTLLQGPVSGCRWAAVTHSQAVPGARTTSRAATRPETARQQRTEVAVGCHGVYARAT